MGQQLPHNGTFYFLTCANTDARQLCTCDYHFYWRHPLPLSIPHECPL